LSPTDNTFGDSKGFNLEEKASFVGCNFTNSLGTQGGALYFYYSSNETEYSVDKCQFQSNRARKLGGAVFVDGQPSLHPNGSLLVYSPLRLYGSTFSNNIADKGGALYVKPFYVKLDERNVTYVNNSAQVGKDKAGDAEWMEFYDTDSLGFPKDIVLRSGGVLPTCSFRVYDRFGNLFLAYTDDEFLSLSLQLPSEAFTGPTNSSTQQLPDRNSSYTKEFDLVGTTTAGFYQGISVIEDIVLYAARPGNLTIRVQVPVIRAGGVISPGLSAEVPVSVLPCSNG
jgi:hypothetical protein